MSRSSEMSFGSQNPPVMHFHAQITTNRHPFFRANHESFTQESFRPRQSSLEANTIIITTIEDIGHRGGDLHCTTPERRRWLGFSRRLVPISDDLDAVRKWSVEPSACEDATLVLTTRASREGTGGRGVSTSAVATVKAAAGNRRGLKTHQ